ncbi:MAG: hypothetical protein RIM72_10385 [Alphaproteobacteria bacterium]
MKQLSEIQQRERELERELNSIKREKQKIEESERALLIKRWDEEARAMFGMNARSLLGLQKPGNNSNKRSAIGKYYYAGEVIDGRAARHRPDFPALKEDRIDDTLAAREGFLNPQWVFSQQPAILKKLGIRKETYTPHDKR